MGFCSLPPLPSAAGDALTSALLVGAGEAALGKMQGKKKYTRGVWVVGWHLSPLPSAYEPPQLVSSAAGCRASLRLCGHRAVSLRAHAGFRCLLKEPCSCPALSSHQDFGGLICFSPCPGLCCTWLRRFPPHTSPSSPPVPSGTGSV